MELFGSHPGSGVRLWDGRDGNAVCRRVLLPTVGQVKSPGEEATDRGEIISQDQQYHRGWTEIDQNCFQVAS